MSLLEYPCLVCNATGTQPAALTPSGRVFRAARPCPQCKGTCAVSRAVVAREIVDAAVSQRRYGVGDSPYRALAERADDSGLLAPYRQALALGSLVRADID